MQTARVVGDRVYILLLIGDGEGEETPRRGRTEMGSMMRALAFGLAFGPRTAFRRSRGVSTNVRLQIDGLDDDDRLVGEAQAWALGDIMPGGETTFVVERVAGAVTYRIAVQSFDVVSWVPPTR